MRVKNAARARLMLLLHLVNAISRAVAADRHVRTETMPTYIPAGLGSTSRIKKGGSAGGGKAKTDRTTAQEQQQRADVLADVLAGSDERMPEVLAEPTRHLAPYLVTVPPLEVQSEAGELLASCDACELPLEPLPGPWSVVREMTRLPVHISEGTYRFKPSIPAEERDAWLALADQLLPDVQAANLADALERRRVLALATVVRAGQRAARLDLPPAWDGSLGHALGTVLPLQRRVEISRQLRSKLRGGTTEGWEIGTAQDPRPLAARGINLATAASWLNARLFLQHLDTRLSVVPVGARLAPEPLHLHGLHALVISESALKLSEGELLRLGMRLAEQRRGSLQREERNRVA